MKTCKVCGIEQALSEYYKAKESVDGHMHKCKTCSRLASKKWREKNPERKKQQFREWVSKNKEHREKYMAEYYELNKDELLSKKREARRSNPEKCREEKRRYREKNKGKYNNYQKDWRKRNPIKAAAHDVVATALKNGKLEKPLSCECCQVFTDTLHAHHCNYTKPLDVMWLCPLCHTDWHKNNTPIEG